MCSPCERNPKDIFSTGYPPWAISGLQVGLILPRMNSGPRSPLFCKFALAEGDFGFRACPINLSNLVHQRREFRMFFNQLPDLWIARNRPGLCFPAGETSGPQDERPPVRFCALSICWFGSRRLSRGILLTR